MDSNLEILKQKRQKVLEDILKEVKSWDKTYGMGMDIVENIEEPLKLLKDINNSLESTLGFVPFDELYEEGILSLEKKHKIIIEKLKNERKKLLELIRETKLKDKIKDNYILKDMDSIFIDKDL